MSVELWGMPQEADKYLLERNGRLDQIPCSLGVAEFALRTSTWVEDLAIVESLVLDLLKNMRASFAIQRSDLEAHALHRAIYKVKVPCSRSGMELHRSGQKDEVSRIRRAVADLNQQDRLNYFSRGCALRWGNVAIVIKGVMDSIVELGKNLEIDRMQRKLQVSAFPIPDGVTVEAVAQPFKDALLQNAGVLLCLAEIAAQQVSGPWGRSWRAREVPFDADLIQQDILRDELILEYGNQLPAERIDQLLIASSNSFKMWMLRSVWACESLSEEDSARIVKIGQEIAAPDLPLDIPLKNLYTFVPQSFSKGSELSQRIYTQIWNQ